MISKKTMFDFLLPFLYVCIGMIACRRTTTTETLVSLGSLANESHNLGGDLYARDQRHLVLKNFRYDGLAPWAYFVVGSAGQEFADGQKIDDVASIYSTNVTFNGDQLLEFNLGTKRVSEISWFIVWCQEVRRVLSRVILPDPLPAIPHAH